jgi:hypothetical protein
MEAKYFCEVCDTKPDQFSHHKAHLQTQKHVKNCESFVVDMKIFSMMFKQIRPNKWHESEYKDYIISKYKSDKRDINGDVVNYDEIKEWIISQNYNAKYNDWNNECFDNKTFSVCYKDETTIEWDRNNNEHTNWAINRILKYKESIQTKPKKIITSHNDARNKRELSKHTNISFNKIKNIRNGLVDLSYLITPIQFLNPKEHDMELYNDDIVKYCCLLFHEYGIHSLYLLHDGYGPIDIEEHPEEKKYNSFYFYKDVNIEHTSTIYSVDYQVSSIEKNSIWVSCYMGDFMDYLDNVEKDYENNKVMYSYISDSDFKYFIKDSLIEIFSNKIKKIEREINYIKEESINFEWKKPNEKVIYDYKKNTGYLVNNNEQPFWNRNNTESGIVGVCIVISDQSRDISLCQKLTEEQAKEYLKFKNEKDESIEKLNEELKFCEKEILKLKELSLNSPIIKSVTQICKYLFEYDEKLIEYYKTHMYVYIAKIEKERMEKALIGEIDTLEV